MYGIDSDAMVSCFGISNGERRQRLGSSLQDILGDEIPHSIDECTACKIFEGAETTAMTNQALLAYLVGLIGSLRTDKVEDAGYDGSRKGGQTIRTFGLWVILELLLRLQP